MKSKIISMKDYKRQHDIPLPRSPYYTLNATEYEIRFALERAAELMQEPCDYRGKPCFAVLVGYENKKNGKVKLLKQQICFPTESAYESACPGINGYYCLALKRRAE